MAKLMATDIYAKIDSGVVVNTQELSAEDQKDPAFTWVIITAMDPMPGIGWSYDGKNLSSPPPPPPQVAEKQPPASADFRGQFWTLSGDDGVADQVQICVKAADGTYSWKTIAFE